MDQENKVLSEVTKVANHMEEVNRLHQLLKIISQLVILSHRITNLPATQFLLALEVLVTVGLDKEVVAKVNNQVVGFLPIILIKKIKIAPIITGS